jgi:hypothetical protein
MRCQGSTRLRVSRNRRRAELVGRLKGLSGCHRSGRSMVIPPQQRRSAPQPGGIDPVRAPARFPLEARTAVHRRTAGRRDPRMSVSCSRCSETPSTWARRFPGAATTRGRRFLLEVVLTAGLVSGWAATARSRAFGRPGEWNLDEPGAFVRAGVGERRLDGVLGVRRRPAGGSHDCGRLRRDPSRTRR